jgi:hypothetical protein
MQKQSLWERTPELAAGWQPVETTPATRAREQRRSEEGGDLRSACGAKGGSSECGGPPATTAYTSSPKSSCVRWVVPASLHGQPALSPTQQLARPSYTSSY